MAGSLKSIAPAQVPKHHLRNLASAERETDRIRRPRASTGAHVHLRKVALRSQKGKDVLRFQKVKPGVFLNRMTHQAAALFFGRQVNIVKYPGTPFAKIKFECIFHMWPTADNVRLLLATDRSTTQHFHFKPCSISNAKKKSETWPSQPKEVMDYFRVFGPNARVFWGQKNGGESARSHVSVVRLPSSTPLVGAGQQGGLRGQLPILPNVWVQFLLPNGFPMLQSNVSNCWPFFQLLAIFPICFH